MTNQSFHCVKTVFKICSDERKREREETKEREKISQKKREKKRMNFSIFKYYIIFSVTTALNEYE